MVDELFEVFEDLFERRKKKKKKKDKDRGEPDGGSRATGAGTAKVGSVFCTECGQKNDADARFCRECGDLLPSAGREPECPGCRQPVPLTAKFCSRCGTALQAGR